MKCPKCNNDNLDGANFCRYCGYNLKDNSSGQVLTDDEKFVEEYIGTSYDSFRNSSFNPGAFFLGPIYLFYRKMYLYAIIFILISMFISACIPVVLNIILGFIINGIYLEKARTDVRTIRRNNNGLSDEEILNLCKKKGGTTFVAPLIYVLIITIILVLAVMLIYYSWKYEEKYSNEYDNNYNETESYDKYELRYEMPSKFEKRSDNYYVSGNYSDNHFCNIIFTNIHKYDDLSDREYFSNRTKKELSSSDVNGQLWYYYIDDYSNSRKTYNYMTTKDKNVFQITYSIYSDDDNYCSDSLKPFINSLKLIDKTGVEA